MPFTTIALYIATHVGSLRNKEEPTKIHGELPWSYKTIQMTILKREETPSLNWPVQTDSRSHCLGLTGSGEGFLYAPDAVFGLGFLCARREQAMTHGFSGHMLSKPFIGNQGKAIVHLVQSSSLVTTVLIGRLQLCLKEEATSKTSKISKVWREDGAGRDTFKLRQRLCHKFMF